MSDEPEIVSALREVLIEEPRIEKSRRYMRKLSELVRYHHDDPNCLLGDRYLCRQGGMLFVAPTGTGKSTAIMQMALLWAVGKPAFGIWPKGKIRTLIIQAENDDGDLAEMRDGVLDGMSADGLLTESEALEAQESITVVREVVATSDELGSTMDGYIAACDCDIVVLDPLFSYLGGDTNNQRDVSHFLRNVINPVLLRRNVGFIAVHHSNKPLSGNQKQDWQAGDFAYLGAGSAEFANWARAVLAVRSIGSHDVYQMVAGKRGKRIGWKDDEGSYVTSKYIKHSSRGLCWLDATKADADESISDSRPQKHEKPMPDLDEYIGIACSKIWTVAEFTSEVRNDYKLSRDAAREFVDLVSASPLVMRARYNENRSPVYVIGGKNHIKKLLDEKGKN
jgi:hypothetical protein